MPLFYLCFLLFFLCPTGAYSGCDHSRVWHKSTHCHVWQHFGSPKVACSGLRFIHQWFVWHNMVRSHTDTVVWILLCSVLVSERVRWSIELLLPSLGYECQGHLWNNYCTSWPIPNQKRRLYWKCKHPKSYEKWSFIIIIYCLTETALTAGVAACVASQIKWFLTCCL